MRPILSISMLASRNQAQVRRCLDSLAPIMEQIPSELIIVDTSQNEAVHEMCLKYTDQVVEFTWCNDFSKARNVGLERASGEWFLYVDDDEWFIDTQELVDFFLSGKYKAYGCANYIQRNFHDAECTFYSDNWVSRMIKLAEDTRFHSKIHEYLAPQVGQCIHLHAIVNHTGYIMQSDADNLRKFERNYPLLLDMMKEEPKRLRWRVQIVQELHNVKKWEELKTFCMESLDFAQKCTSKEDFRDIGTFYAGLLESLVALKEYDAALKAAEASQIDTRVSRLCYMYQSLLLARLYFQRREWDAADRQLDTYLEGLEYFEKNPKELEKQSGALLVESALDDVLQKRAISLRVGCALMRGDTSVLEAYYDRLGWEKHVMYLSDDLFPVLMEAMAAPPQQPILDRAMQDLWNNAEAAQKVFAAVEGYREKDEQAYRALFRMTARMEGSFWYLWYAKMIVADWDDADVDYGALFVSFCENTSDVFLTPPVLLDILKKHNLTPEEGYLSVPYEKWKQQLDEYIQKAPLQDIRITEKELSELRSREDIRYDYALMHLARAQVLKSRELKYLGQGLWNYGNRATAFAMKYYQPQVLDEYRELLPTEVLAGVLVGQALERQKENMQETIYYFDCAAKRDDALSTPLVAYLKLLETDRQNRQKHEKEELRQLEIKIKKEVQRCLDEQRYADAMEILVELKGMRPNDLDVAQMTLEARIGLMG